MIVSGSGYKYPLFKTISSITIVMAAFVFLNFGIALGSSGGEHDGGGEDHGTKGWVKTDTYRVMNFSVLAVGLFLLLRKPLAGTLNARIKDIQSQLKDLEIQKKEAEARLVQYNEKLSLLDGEAEKIIAEYIRQGNDAKVRILDEAESVAKKLEDQALRNIKHEFQQAKLNLQQDILEKALVKAEDLIKNKITTEDQDRLVDEYLDKVVA